MLHSKVLTRRLNTAPHLLKSTFGLTVSGYICCTFMYNLCSFVCEYLLGKFNSCRETYCISCRVNFSPDARFQVFRAVTFQIVVFRVVTPRSNVLPPSSGYSEDIVSTSPHGVTAQKTARWHLLGRSGNGKLAAGFTYLRGRTKVDGLWTSRVVSKYRPCSWRNVSTRLVEWQLTFRF
jgi:hypothetical protein